MYAWISGRHLIEHFQESLLCRVLNNCWIEGRRRLSARSFLVAMIHFALGFASHFKYLLGNLTRLHVGNGVNEGYLALEGE